MKLRLIFVLLASALASCAPAVDPTTSPFDQKEAAFVKNHGSAVVTGQGFMRQMGGGIVTCAGEEVNLFPVTKYSQERVTYLYGSPNGGTNSYKSIAPADPQYEVYQRKAQCDAQGNFKFSGVASGSYYVTTRVVWVAGEYSLSQGGAIAKRVSVSGSQTVNVILN